MLHNSCYSEASWRADPWRYKPMLALYLETYYRWTLHCIGRLHPKREAFLQNIPSKRGGSVWSHCVGPSHSPQNSPPPPPHPTKGSRVSYILSLLWYCSLIVVLYAGCTCVYRAFGLLPPSQPYHNLHVKLAITLYYLTSFKIEEVNKIHTSLKLVRLKALNAGSGVMVGLLPSSLIPFHLCELVILTSLLGYFLPLPNWWLARCIIMLRPGCRPF